MFLNTEVDYEDTCAEAGRILDRLVMIDKTTKEKISFTLSSSVNHKLLSACVSHAYDQRRKPTEVKGGSTAAIDLYNDMMSRKSKNAQSKKFFEDAGRGEDDDRTNIQKAECWATTLAFLHNAGFKIEPFEDAVLFRLNAAEKERNEVENPAEIATTAKMAGLSEDVVRTMLKVSRDKKVDSFLDILKESVGTAYAILDDTSYVNSFRPDPALPEMVEKAFMSAKKSAVRFSTSSKDALAELIMIHADQEASLS